MKRKAYSISLICLIAFVFTACNTQHETEDDEINQISTPVPTISSDAVLPYEQLDLPEDFMEKSYEHVKNITSFGVREDGSEAEASTIDYIMNYLGEIGIEAMKEEFTYQNFNLNKVMINGSELDIERIYLNPDNNPILNGVGKIYYQSDELHGEVAIQKKSAPLNILLEAINDKDIKAVILTSDDVFKQIHNEDEFQVDIDGKTEEKTSYNVVAKISSTKSDAKDIIIGAHMDSIYGVGADDNASGVGDVLELAKYYYSMKDTLEYNIIFVFYAAEEMGFIGSKAYISEHAKELSNCALVFNVDVVGGKDIYIESAGGVKGDFWDLQSPNKDLCAKTDRELKWWNNDYNNSDSEYCSMVPDWLLKNIKDSCSELNCTYQPGNGMGSDHQSFAQYGIPSTDITVLGNDINSTADTLDKVDPDSMLKAARIVASVVNKTMLNDPVE